MINMPGGPELMVIVLIALIVLGPQQLPKAMRTFGNVMAEIRKVSSGFQAEMKSAMDSITDDSPSKPQSGSMSAVDSSSRPATEPVDADVTEIVARNDSRVDEAHGATEVEPASTAEATDTRPVIDPVDRAAG